MDTTSFNAFKIFVYIDLGRPATWKLTPQDPYPLHLKSLPHCSMLSPSVHSQIVPSRDYRSNAPRLLGITDTYAVILSQYIIFQFATIDALKSCVPPEASDKMSYFLTDFLPSMSSDFVGKLRYITKQARLPTQPGYGLIGRKDEPVIPTFPSASNKQAESVSAYDLDTAITAHSLRSTDELPSTDGIPIHSSLILDAIQAFLEHDFRRTLLYSAISMETYCATALQDSYLQSLNATSPPPHLRISSFARPKGHTRSKDPIFAHLAEKSKTEFALLLHEIPLYLTRRSLLLDNEHLYQRARRLYTTRNRIVHRGVVTEEDTGLFAFTVSDASIGLQTALDVCRWFGMSEPYPLPTMHPDDIIHLRQAES